MKLYNLTKYPSFTVYEGDNRFDGRQEHTFERQLIQGECSEIDNVHLLVSLPTPLTQYLPFLVSQVDNFSPVAIILITGGRVPYNHHITKQQHTYNIYYLGLLYDALSCLLRTCCFLTCYDGAKQSLLQYDDAYQLNTRSNVKTINAHMWVRTNGTCQNSCIE